MSIKLGDVVSHAAAAEWGVGKVVEAGLHRVTILFNDGATRKIAGSHFKLLLPAAQDSFLPVPADEPKIVPKNAVRAAAGGKKKSKP